MALKKGKRHKRIKRGKGKKHEDSPSRPLSDLKNLNGRVYSKTDVKFCSFM